MRHVTGISTTRSLQGRAAALGIAIYAWLSDHARTIHGLIRSPVASHNTRISLHDGVVVNLSVGTYATGCQVFPDLSSYRRVSSDGPRHRSRDN